ncbi:MAG: DUF1521 domain-containing protein [Deltaproteobacteria bacterium]|nr:DUF1521 domain-containing protein [Deltaproteobacteria bacterium]
MWYNVQSLNPFAATQLQFALVSHLQQNPQVAMQALSMLNAGGFDQCIGPSLQQLLGRGMGASMCGAIPQPNIGFSGAPAGQGLQKAPEGWPGNAVKTAGGYTIVPEGGTNWSIYAPGQKPGETPNTRVWGDPHVTEKDGTRWDFTKSSDFVLPDGTRIAAQTSSEQGQSVTTGLTITNGADRVNVSNIHGSPTTGAVTNDGYEWRAQHLASNPGRDTFRLGGDGNNIHWFRERNGQVEGRIDGTVWDSKNNRYDQVVSGDNKYWVDPNLRAPLGSAAWGNQMRGELADTAGLTGNPQYAKSVGELLNADHLWSQLGGNMFGQQGLGGLCGAFSGCGQACGAVGGLGDTMLGHAGLLALASQGMTSAAFNPAGRVWDHTTTEPGRPATFPPAKGSSFLNRLPSNPNQVASQLNVSGYQDVRTINTAASRLREAGAVARPAKPGETGAAGKLVLSDAEVAAIRAAPNEAEARKLVAQAISRQTGVNIGDGPNMGNRNDIRNDRYRQALNSLTGSHVRSGIEKNSGSALALDSIIDSTCRTVRGADFGSTIRKDTVAWSGPYGVIGGTDRNELNNPSTAVALDISSYRSAADKIAELYSPLIFDLDGTGLVMKNGGMIEVDLDGDGRREMITDLDAHLGLLVFDSQLEPEALRGTPSGRDMFGNGTDLSAYGIKGPKDGSFENGFDALRALAEKLGYVKGTKQHLSGRDLEELEDKVGLRMRVGGIGEGEDKRFIECGVTRINLGDSKKIQSIEQAKEDRWGNKLMMQDGATFMVKNTERPYCDIWFNIQARVLEKKDNRLEAKRGADLLKNVGMKRLA